MRLTQDLPGFKNLAGLGDSVVKSTALRLRLALSAEMTMTANSIFHQGELEIQQRLGVESAAAKLSALIQPAVPLAAFDFIRQQTGVWLGITDNMGLPWAFPVSGLPGFIEPGDGDLLAIALGGCFPVPDPWLAGLQRGNAIGCLLIDLANRRRLRINGVINVGHADRLEVAVRQVYPNCSKYITPRTQPQSPDGGRWHSLAAGTRLDESLQAVIEQADTAFVASWGPNGSDVSHRGGPCGFITRITADSIAVPDYPGNNLFNTLGNFNRHPVAGLSIVDVESGRVLQLSGDVKIIIDAERRWELTTRQWRLWQWDNETGAR